MFKIIICILAGLGAGLGTGFAGMSAAAVISPMLITFLHMDPYLGRWHWHLPAMSWPVPLPPIPMAKIKTSISKTALS